MSCQGDVIIKLGSSLGEECLILSKYLGEEGKKKSNEAHPRIAHGLGMSVKSDNLKNFRVFNSGISETEGEIEITNNSNRYLGNSLAYGQLSSVRGPSVTLIILSKKK